MPRLRAFSGAELCNFLSEHGFESVRQRGSHVIMRRGQVSFPVPLHRQLDRGTLEGGFLIFPSSPPTDSLPACVRGFAVANLLIFFRLLIGKSFS